MDTKGNSEPSQISCFKSLESAPYDAVFDVHAACAADKHENRIDGLNGLYFGENLQLYAHEIIKKVELDIINDSTLNYAYLPADGHAGFNAATEKLNFEGTKPYEEKRIATCQTISATGALRITFELLLKMGHKEISFFVPNWPSFWLIAEGAGIKVNELKFLDEKNEYSFELMLNSLEGLKDGSAVIFHTSANNPTGFDTTKEEYITISKLFKRKNLIPIMDSAYCGYSTGDLADDSDIIKIFVNLDLPVFVLHSFGKTMAIYGERIGTLHIVCESSETRNLIQGNLKFFAKRLYTAPPRRGALMVYKILTNSEYYEAYCKSLKMAAEDLVKRRESLRKAIEDAEIPGNWERITKQRGIFVSLGLNETQLARMAEKHHIYFQKNGRFSVCALNNSNMNHFVTSLKETLSQDPK